jgi:hypothetical protein
LRKDKKLITDEKEMAEELNRFFSSVFTYEDTTNIPEPVKENVRKKMNPVVVWERDVERKIMKLRKEAAPGPDGIRPSLLKQFSSSLINPLTVIFNKSLETGEVPEGWKKANVTPIFKKGTKGYPGN